LLAVAGIALAWDTARDAMDDNALDSDQTIATLAEGEEDQYKKTEVMGQKIDNALLDDAAKGDLPFPLARFHHTIQFLSLAVSDRDGGDMASEIGDMLHELGEAHKEDSREQVSMLLNIENDFYIFCIRFAHPIYVASWQVLEKHYNQMREKLGGGKPPCECGF